MWSDVRRKLGSLVTSPAGPSVRAGGRVWHLSAEGHALFGCAGPALDQWLAGDSAAVVKHGPHRTVYRIGLPTETVYVKHCRINGPRAGVREVVRPPKARLEFENAARLISLGIGAAVPLAWGAADSLWPGESFLITRDLAPAVPFTDFIESHTPASAERRQLARGLGRFLALLHDRGVTHPDPHPGNLLVSLEEPNPPAPFPGKEGGESPSAVLSPLSPWGRGLGVGSEEPNPPAPFPKKEGGVGFCPSLLRGGAASEASGERFFAPRFSLLDVHAVRFGEPLSWRESLANLVRYNRWFQLRASAADRCRFWREYRRSRQTLAVPRGAAIELESATLASNRRFWMARTARYEGTHRTIRAVRAGNVRGLAVRDLPDDFLTELLRDPDGAFDRPGTKILKRCVTSTVAELPMPTPAGPKAVILKRVNVRSALDPLKNLVRSSAVRRSWLQGHGLCERWLPTPRPLAMFHRRRAGILPAEGYLLTEKVPDAIGLSEAVRTCRDPLILRAWAGKLARVVRAMHDRGVSHRDLKAPNVMLQGAAIDPTSVTPVLIDLVGVRASSAAVPVARRAKELARLNASFLAVSHVTRGERLRFLLAYLRAGERQADWKSWWKLVSQATAAKVAKSARTGRAIG